MTEINGNQRVYISFSHSSHRKRIRSIAYYTLLPHYLYYTRSSSAPSIKNIKKKKKFMPRRQYFPSRIERSTAVIRP